MRQVLTVLALVMVLMQSAVSAVPAAGEPLPARIGGDRESFEERYGEPDEGEKTVSFEDEEYGGIEAFFHKNYLVWVSVVSPRPEDKSLTRADDADRTVEEAQKVATEFLPRDAKVDKETTESDEGDLVMTAHSEALEKRFSAATYRQYKAKGDQGDLRVEMLLTKAGDVSSLVVSLGNKDAGVTVPEPKPEPTPTPASASGFTDEEQEYLNQVSELTETMSASLRRFSQLFSNPRIGATDWTVAVATEFAIWQATYDDASAIDPPPVFADMHATLVSALELYVQASQQASYGIDNFDADSIAQGVESLNQANALIAEALSLLNEIKEERGV